MFFKKWRKYRYGVHLQRQSKTVFHAQLMHFFTECWPHILADCNWCTSPSCGCRRLTSSLRPRTLHNDLFPGIGLLSTRGLLEGWACLLVEPGSLLRSFSRSLMFGIARWVASSIKNSLLTVLEVTLLFLHHSGRSSMKIVWEFTPVTSKMLWKCTVGQRRTSHRVEFFLHIWSTTSTPALVEL